MSNFPKIGLCQIKSEHADDNIVVQAILESADFSMDNQFSSPFENSNVDNRFPNIMGMLQSGSLSNMIASVTGQEQDASDKSGLIGQLDSLKGRSNFTKVNSEQIYVSSSPVKISGTLILFSENDAKEVENQIKALQTIVAPIFLSSESLLASTASSMRENGVLDGALSGLFPSLIPVTVSFTYAKKTYKNLVLENFSAPLVTPLNPHGHRIMVKAQFSLLSRQAWDRSDIAALYQ